MKRPLSSCFVLCLACSQTVLVGTLILTHPFAHYQRSQRSNANRNRRYRPSLFTFFPDTCSRLNMASLFDQSLLTVSFELQPFTQRWVRNAQLFHQLRNEALENVRECTVVHVDVSALRQENEYPETVSAMTHQGFPPFRSNCFLVTE